MDRIVQPVEIAWHAQAELGEGPMWDASRNTLWWVDIEQSRLHSYRPEVLKGSSFPILSHLSSVVCTNSQQLLLASRGDIVLFEPDTTVMRSLAEVERDGVSRRLNDGKCDPAGRYWVGSVTLNLQDRPVGSLYSFDRSNGISRVLPRVGISNGMAWSLDHRTMYYVDSAIRTVDAFDFDVESGGIANRRVVFDVPVGLGIADGMTIDAEDKLWVAFWGGGCVARIDPIRQTIEQKIQLPCRHVTSCAFGGPTLQQLYITTARYGLSADQLIQQPYAGSLFVAEPGTPGIAPDVFKMPNQASYDGDYQFSSQAE